MLPLNVDAWTVARLTTRGDIQAAGGRSAIPICNPDLQSYAQFGRADVTIFRSFASAFPREAAEGGLRSRAITYTTGEDLGLTSPHRRGRAQPFEERRRFRSPMPGHPRLLRGNQDVDARHKAGHDESAVTK